MDDVSGIEDVIATRQLELDGVDGAVEVLIGRPQPWPDEPSYRCQIQIKGLGSSRVLEVGGADTMQALYLAMQAVGARLCTASEAKAGRLEWLGERCPFGFPLPDSIADLAEGSD